MGISEISVLAERRASAKSPEQKNLICVQGTVRRPTLLKRR